MSGPAAILRELHRLRRHAKDLETEVERLPRVLKAQQIKITRQQEKLQAEHENLKRLKVHIHDKEVTLRAKGQDISKHEKQLNEAKSKKEYDALREEVAAGNKARSDIEDEILNFMGELEEHTALVPALENDIEQAKKEVAEFEALAQTRLAALTEQLNEVLKKLEEVSSSLPVDIRPLYDRLMTARGEDALAAVQNRTCTACNTGITAQNYNELMQSFFVVCKTCGRILYLPE